VIALGIGLRHDWGSQYRARQFQASALVRVSLRTARTIKFTTLERLTESAPHRPTTT